MNSPAITAAAAGTWELGDLAVNRLGFGAMRLTGSLPFGKGAPSDRERSITVLRDPAHLTENVAAAALRLTPGDLAVLR